MEQGKHTKNRILRPNVRPRKHTFSLAQQIRMREHYALGIGSGSRSVEKGSEVIGSARHGSKRSTLSREDTVKIRYSLWGNGRPRPFLIWCEDTCRRLLVSLRGDSRPRLS